jgi:hypothetical protein
MHNARTILEKYNVPVATVGDPHYRPNWVNTACPYCMSSKNHLGIALNLSRANCYKCGPKSVVSALQKLTGSPYQEARLLALASGPVEIQEKTYGTYTPPPGLVDLTHADRKYLKDKRKLDPDLLVERYGLRSIGPFSGLPHGIFIPITYRQNPISWQVRYRDPGDGIRYRTAKDSEKSMSEKDILFGSEVCTHTILIVEGFFDMANVGPGAVCTFGLAYTSKPLLLMSRFARRVVCFDNSADAQKVAAKLAADLAVFPGETFQVCLDAADPGSAEPKEIALLRRTVGI